ncbi:armadillo-type protein [Xylogone sp. PMI_703]|nr:armadillo-type protein [Xylogone sp. PMI_703]
MSLDPPTYLFSLQNNIRGRPIPWEGAVRAGTISEDQLSKIRAVDKVRKEQRKQTIESDLNGYRTLFLGGDGKQSVFEAASRRADVVQYLLVLLGDLLDNIPDLSKALSQHPDPYKPFVPLLAQPSSPEEAIPLLTSTVLTTLIAASPSSSVQNKTALPKLYSYLSLLAKSTDGGLQDIAVLQYSALLRGKESREIFWAQRKQTVSPLIDILRAASSVNTNGDSSSSSSTLFSGSSTPRGGPEGSLGGGVGLQLLYHVLLVIWQLSFEGAAIGEGLESEYEFIFLYTQLLKLSPKEKTTRLLISTLYNLLSSDQKTLLPAATLARLPALLQNLNGRHLTDPDLLEDVQKLTEMLDEYTKTQTNFDEYYNEINSGHLRWSPPHRSPVFWAENARRILEHENGELPRKLAEIMSKPWDNDKQVLAIACNDIGWLVKEVPEKRYQLEKLGLKRRVMELMTEPDETVRWESLNALGGWLKYSFETK